MLVHGHDPLHPADDVGIGFQVEISLVGEMGVGEQANVGEAELIADEPFPAVQMLVHQGERCRPALALAPGDHIATISSPIVI
jgi:hypothetical protein